jgi:hypothetical protein
MPPLPPFVAPDEPQPRGVNPDLPPFVDPDVPAPQAKADARLAPDEYPTPVTGEAVPTPSTAERPATKPYEDYPTLVEMPPFQSHLTGLGLAMAETPEGRANILRKNEPGVTFENDKYGNPLVVKDGKKYHIDRPDTFNDQNVGYGIAQAVPTIAGTAAALASGPPGWLGALLAGGAGYGSNQGRAWIARQAGSEEPFDPFSMSSMLEGGFNAVGPATGGALGRLMRASRLSSGARRVLSSSEQAELALSKAHSDDLTFHTDPANAAELVRRHPFTPISEDVEKAAATHADAAPQRIAGAVDQAFGTANTDISKAIQAVKPGGELETVLSKAGPIDASPVVKQIDDAIAAAAPNSPKARALQQVRSMLVEQEGVAGTPGQRMRVDGSTDPNHPGIYRMTPGTSAQPPVYVSDPTKLHEAKRAFDQMVTWGDPGVGIAPKTVPKDAAIKGIRGALSDTLENNVPGYKDVMDRYVNAHEMSDAYDQGQKIMAGGKNALTMKDVQPILDADPNTATAFKTGVRDALEARMRTASAGKDVGAIKSLLSGENSYRREILNNLYGKDAVDKLAATAEREGNYASTNQLMQDAAQQGRNAAGAARAAKSTEPIIPEGLSDPRRTLFGSVAQGVGKAGNFLASRLFGSHGPAFQQNIARALTSPGIETLENLSAKPSSSRAVPIATSAMAPTVARSAALDDREGHASGGRVGDHSAAAKHLIGLVDKARRLDTEQTKPLLKVPDHAVATALAAANRSI